ncbi:plasmid pRiA4b ORF-3 family protein [Actinospica sp.]|uniref:plasmid pRiA4b ORF-3 family protein n=1 Tax=Actinospica sp. TaxID=1872142 RepID=UPI002CD83D56|nr:plasmid pRiA4b ORF-3 family protein [Actinospica sp.]HWG22548.1 plasmid pRiA4b ORF-3 family protein [Actinospica sp.]
MSKDSPEGEAADRLRRPARIVRRARRNAAHPEPAPPEETVPRPRSLGLDPADLAGALLADLAEIADQDDPFEFEMMVSSFCGILDMAQNAALVGSLPPDVVPTLVAHFEERADELSLAVLASLALLAEGEAGAAAARGAARLWRAGILPPDWFEELDRALHVEDCLRVRRELDGDLLYLLSFRRAGRRHAFAVVVRDEDEGPAEAIAPLPAEVLPERLADIVGELVPRDELDTVTVTELEPAEARRLLETAIRTRALQDARLDLDARFAQWDEAATPGVLGAPPYPTMLAALRNRLDALPAPPRPVPDADLWSDEDYPDGFEYDSDMVFPEFPAAFGAVVFIADHPHRDVPAPGPGLTRISPPLRRLPLDAPAPVYRLRIDLKGAKPPIWRRVEIPGDLTLAALHDVIQTVFEWEGYHLHVFETAYGDFGDGDVDLGHGLDDEVTIEQILTGAGAKLTYVYDYGDYWEHVVRVERTYQGDPEVHYPRCIGGRRAAPPEDCGGLWEYQESLREHGDAGADVFDRDELNRRLNEGRWQGGHWDVGGPS